MPGIGAAKTMYAAFYGELVPHPRPDIGDELSQDAYSLFYARSAAMGWLTPATEEAQGGLWRMNDAEAGPGAGPQSSRVAFFQVSLTEPTQGKLLPVQPFLSCAGDVVTRQGTLRLDAVQVLLPEHDADADAQFASPSGMRTARASWMPRNWFAECDPRQRVPVRFTLDGLADPAIRAAAPAIVRWVQGIDQDVFACESFSLADDHLVLLPTTTFLGGPDSEHHRVTFRGTLAEWSLDALGWLAVFLADLSSWHGVSTPLVLIADRPSPAG